jgi:hypothetical protein
MTHEDRDRPRRAARDRLNGAVLADRRSRTGGILDGVRIDLSCDF